MNGISSEQVLADVIEAIRALADDWGYSGPLSADTRMYADMELHSLAFVTLAAAMVNRYGPIPFDDFYTKLGEQDAETREVTIGEFAEFVTAHLSR